MGIRTGRSYAKMHPNLSESVSMHDRASVGASCCLLTGIAVVDYIQRFQRFMDSRRACDAAARATARQCARYYTTGSYLEDGMRHWLAGSAKDAVADETSVRAASNE